LTCYFRHLESLLRKADIKVTADNRKELDRIIHELVGVNYKDCSGAWRQVKQRLADDEEGFVLQLKTAWQNHT
jgi:ribosomal protein L17